MPVIPDAVLIYRRVGKRALRLFAFLPKNHRSAQPIPGVLVIHGGGWRNSSAEVEFVHARALADAGLASYCLEYRLAISTADEVRNCVRDARAAMRYLRTHAAKLGIDPMRIAAAGGSAGGHLALGTVLFDELDSPSDRAVRTAPDALILRYAVVDTSSAGYGHDLLGADWESLSPLHRLRAGMPPTLMFHGTADKVAPYAGATVFRDRMIALGNPCELVTARDAPHTHVRLDLELARDANVREAAFLRGLGWTF